MPTLTAPPPAPAEGEGVDADGVRSLVEAIGELMHAKRESGIALARAIGCTPSALPLIMALDRIGASSLGDLAHELRVDPSVASRQAGALVDDGYVERTVADDDRRSRTFALTERGHETVARTLEHFGRQTRDRFAGWTADDLADAVRVLRRIALSIGVPENDDAPQTPTLLQENHA